MRKEFSRRLEEVGAVAGYLCDLSPADLLLGHSLLERGAEVHVVLPFPRQYCREPFAPYDEWVSQFDRLLAVANSTNEEAELGDPEQTVQEQFASLRGYGSGWLRAKRLDVELRLWGFRQCAETRVSRTDFLVRHWQDQDCSWEEIPVPFETVPRGAVSQSEQDPELPAPAWSADHEIRAMLFADIEGYSRLSDAELRLFTRHFLPEVGRVLAAFGDHIVLRETAGDSLFLVFSDMAVAAQTAFALRNMVVQTGWRAYGLPAELPVRVSLDAGPVCSFQNPVTNRRSVCGRYVNRAARIEPITPPNEVYASEAIASLYVACGGTAFRFDYVGQTQLPKGFGLAPLYCVAETMGSTWA
jgi:class 3 adenylate cyclase